LANTAGFIPSLFTVLNLFCGFISIINAAAGNIHSACMFIIYSALFDMIDGIAARFTRTSSRFGVELDSLADVVSFGVAPSFILYKAYYFQTDGPGIAIASLIMIFAALRLARFNANLKGFDKDYFIGVPVPIPALTLSSFFLFYYNRYFSQDISIFLIYLISIFLPLVMVSRFRYDTLPRFSFHEIKTRPVKYILLFIIILTIIATKGEGLFVFCIFYVFSGIIRWLKNLIYKFFFPDKYRLPELQSESTITDK
jgi:CDP-diacylglycerol--serine O-phosphatidyltransferase